MSNYAFNYSFNISGNCNAVVNEIAENVGELRQNLAQTTSVWDSFEGKLLALNQFTDYLGNLRNSFSETMAPGAALNQSLADLQAISGATGKELETVEKFARRTAREFGGSAAGAVESYKLLLSQLSPELTKNTEALDAMGRNIAILSKTMGGDTTAAAEVLTTAMNQYGVSLEDPMEASRKMAEMMNIMAAAGREGSAELPSIKVALEQCGMAAKAAGVSFAETNAAIQVLDKAGKKGSEGGVALRNVMSTLAQGRFLPKDVQEELAAAGVKISDLADQSKSLSERLTLLKPVMQDSALFSKLFGRENANAAMALVQGTAQIETWTDAISGTNTAVEQSEIIMETYNEKLARVRARFDDMKISVFNCCGDLGIWVEVVASALIPVSQLIPLLSGLAKGIAWVRALQFHKAFDKVRSKILGTIAGMQMMNATLVTSGGFWTAFKVVAQNACRSIGVAIMNIPIIGWIAAGIAVVIAIVQLLWDKCKGFRIAIFTAWEAIKAAGNALVIIFKSVWEQLGYAFDWINSKVKSVVNFYISMWSTVFGVVAAVVSRVKSVFTAVVGFLSEIPARVGAIFAAVRAPIASVVDWVANTVSAVWNRVVAIISGFVQRIIDIFSSIWNAISDFAQRVAGIFVSVFNRIKNAFASLRNWIVGIVNAIIAKVRSICEPLVNAFNTVAAKVKSVFGGVLDWVRGKIDSVINWFIDLYNKIASVMNWEKIKNAGKAAGEKSWAADHPESKTPVDDGAGVQQSGNAQSAGIIPAAGADGGSSSIGAGLGSIGGKSDKTDRVKNINITIEKLIETFTISTTNMSESRERLKDMVSEILVSAVNDANYAI